MEFEQSIIYYLISSRNYDKLTDTIKLKITNLSKSNYIKLQSENIDDEMYTNSYEYIGFLKKKKILIEKELANKGYYIKYQNCTYSQDDLFSTKLFTQKLKRNKSNNCLDYLQLYVQDFKKEQLLFIIKYSKILYDIIKNEIIDLLQNNIYKWYKKIFNIFNKTILNYKKIIKQNNQDIYLYILIIEHLNSHNTCNKNILVILNHIYSYIKDQLIYKNILIILKDIHNKLKDNFKYQNIIESLITLFEKLIKNKYIKNNILYLTIKEKLIEQFKIKKIFKFILQEKAYIIQKKLLIDDNKNINECINKIDIDINEFIKLLKIQYDVYFNNLYKIVYLFITKNITVSKMNQKIYFPKFEENLLLGNSEISLINIKIIYPNLLILINN